MKANFMLVLSEFENCANSQNDKVLSNDLLWHVYKYNVRLKRVYICIIKEYLLL